LIANGRPTPAIDKILSTRRETSSGIVNCSSRPLELRPTTCETNMTGRHADPVPLGAATNAAIRAAVAEQLRRVQTPDLLSCPPRLRNLIDQLRRQDEASPPRDALPPLRSPD